MNEIHFKIVGKKCALLATFCLVAIEVFYVYKNGRKSQCLFVFVAFLSFQLKNVGGNNKLKVKAMHQTVERIGKMMTQIGLSFEKEEITERRKNRFNLNNNNNNMN